MFGHFTIMRERVKLYMYMNENITYYLLHITYLYMIPENFVALKLAEKNIFVLTNSRK